MAYNGVFYRFLFYSYSLERVLSALPYPAHSPWETAQYRFACIIIKSVRLLRTCLPLFSEVVESSVSWKILFIVSFNTKWYSTQGRFDKVHLCHLKERLAMIKHNLLHSNSSCSLKYPGYPCIKVKMLILIFAFCLIFKTFISFQISLIVLSMLLLLLP